MPVYPEERAYDNPPFFEWDYPDPCIVDSYRIELSSDPTFAVWFVSMRTPNAIPERYWLEELENCSLYYYRIAATVGDVSGPFSETREFLVDKNATCSPLPPLPEAIVTNPVTPILTVAPTLGPAMFTTLTNAHCRQGPSQVYEIVTSVAIGESLPVVGRDEEDTWYYIQTTRFTRCWISVVTGRLGGDIAAIPISNAYPPPPVFDACSDYEDKNTCLDDPYGIGGCGWDDKAQACKP